MKTIQKTIKAFLISGCLMFATLFADNNAQETNIHKIDIKELERQKEQQNKIQEMKKLSANSNFSFLKYNKEFFVNYNSNAVRGFQTLFASNTTFYKKNIATNTKNSDMTALRNVSNNTFQLIETPKFQKVITQRKKILTNEYFQKLISLLFEGKNATTFDNFMITPCAFDEMSDLKLKKQFGAIPVRTIKESCAQNITIKDDEIAIQNIISKLKFYINIGQISLKELLLETSKIICNNGWYFDEKDEILISDDKNNQGKLMLTTQDINVIFANEVLYEKILKQIAIKIYKIILPEFDELAYMLITKMKRKKERNTQYVSTTMNQKETNAINMENVKLFFNRVKLYQILLQSFGEKLTNSNNRASFFQNPSVRKQYNISNNNANNELRDSISNKIYTTMIDCKNKYNNMIFNPFNNSSQITYTISQYFEKLRSLIDRTNNELKKQKIEDVYEKYLQTLGITEDYLKNKIDSDKISKFKENFKVILEGYNEDSETPIQKLEQELIEIELEILEALLNDITRIGDQSNTTQQITNNDTLIQQILKAEEEILNKIQDKEKLDYDKLMQIIKQDKENDVLSLYEDYLYGNTTEIFEDNEINYEKIYDKIADQSYVNAMNSYYDYKISYDILLALQEFLQDGTHAKTIENKELSKEINEIIAQMFSTQTKNLIMLQKQTCQLRDVKTPLNIVEEALQEAKYITEINCDNKEFAKKEKIKDVNYNISIIEKNLQKKLTKLETELTFTQVDDQNKLIEIENELKQKQKDTLKAKQNKKNELEEFNSKLESKKREKSELNIAILKNNEQMKKIKKDEDALKQSQETLKIDLNSIQNEEQDIQNKMEQLNKFKKDLENQLRYLSNISKETKTKAQEGLLKIRKTLEILQKIKIDIFNLKEDTQTINLKIKEFNIKNTKKENNYATLCDFTIDYSKELDEKEYSKIIDDDAIETRIKEKITEIRNEILNWKNQNYQGTIQFTIDNIVKKQQEEENIILEKLEVEIDDLLKEHNKKAQNINEQYTNFTKNIEIVYKESNQIIKEINAVKEQAHNQNKAIKNINNIQDISNIAKEETNISNALQTMNDQVNKNIQRQEIRMRDDTEETNISNALQTMNDEIDKLARISEYENSEYNRDNVMNEDKEKYLEKLKQEVQNTPISNDIFDLMEQPMVNQDEKDNTNINDTQRNQQNTIKSREYEDIESQLSFSQDNKLINTNLNDLNKGDQDYTPTESDQQYADDSNLLLNQY